MSLHQTQGRITVASAELTAADRDPDDLLAELVALAIAAGHQEVRTSTWTHPISGVMNATLTAATDIVIITDDPLSEWDAKHIAELRAAGHRPLMVKALFVPQAPGGWRLHEGVPVGRIGEIEGPFCDPDCPACMGIMFGETPPLGAVGSLGAGAGIDHAARGVLIELIKHLQGRIRDSRDHSPLARMLKRLQ